MAVSGFSPVMPHPEQDASVFSRSHFLDYTFSITLSIFDNGNDLPGGVPHCRHIYRTAQFVLKRRALNLLREENTP
jgi:hypothetical protein